jgi:hypothetical protein
MVDNPTLSFQKKLLTKKNARLKRAKKLQNYHIAGSQILLPQ